MKITFGAASDIGQVREGNEDSYLIEEPLFAVADGMGGHRGGEVASNLALETIRELFDADEGSLTEQVERANEAVFDRSQTDSEVQGMGTTLTAALVQGAQIRLAHVGDSRAYLLRRGRLSRLTKDHTLVARMVDEGEISESEAETHPHRSILTRALGVDGRVQVDDGIVQMQDGDRLLLCTDGLTGMVPHEEIRAVLEEVRDPQEAAERLVRAANAAGGIDNITAVILDFASDGDPEHGRDRTAVGTQTPTAPPTADPSEALGRTETAVAARPLAEASPSERRGSSGVSDPRGSGRASDEAAPEGRVARRVGIGVAVLLVVGMLGLVGLRFYLDSQWFVGVSNGRVAIFRGVPAEVGALELHSVVVETSIPAGQATDLAVYRDLADGITADDRPGAEAIVQQIRADIAAARPDRS